MAVVQYDREPLYDQVLPGQPFVRLTAGKFKTVPSSMPNNLIGLMKEARPETEYYRPLSKSSYRCLWH